MGVLVGRVRLGEEQLGGRGPELVARLVDRGQRDRRRAGELDVVVPDDRQLARDVDAQLGHVLEQPEGDEVVGAERRRRTAAAGQRRQDLTGPSTGGDEQAVGLDDGERVGIAAGGGHRPACARPADR